MQNCPAKSATILFFSTDFRHTKIDLNQKINPKILQTTSKNRIFHIIVPHIYMIQITTYIIQILKKAFKIRFSLFFLEQLIERPWTPFFLVNLFFFATSICVRLPFFQTKKIRQNAHFSHLIYRKLCK